jgi:hypothetical protein
LEGSVKVPQKRQAGFGLPLIPDNSRFNLENPVAVPISNELAAHLFGSSVEFLKLWEIRMTSRKRGRPVGSEINDHEALTNIAKLFLSSPGMKLASAMRQIRVSIKYTGASPRAVEERWRRKWKEWGGQLLEEMQKHDTEKFIAPQGSQFASPNHPSRLTLAAMGLPADSFVQANNAWSTLLSQSSIQEMIHQTRLAQAAVGNLPNDILMRIDEARKVHDRIIKSSS